MKRCTSLLAFFLALGATAAQAQFTDTFTTPRFVPEWTFGGVSIPGVNYPTGANIGGYGAANAGTNTEKALLYTTGNGFFVNTMTQGNANQPSLTFAPNSPSSWDIYCTVTPDATFASIEGLCIYTNKQNNVQFLVKYNANGGNPYNYVSCIVTQANAHPGTNYDNLTFYGHIPAATPVTLHIKKSLVAGVDTITFSNMLPGGNDNVTGTASAADTDLGKAAIYSMLSNVGGQYLSLFYDNYYSSTNNSVVTYSNFSATLPVVHPQANATDQFLGPKLGPMWVVANESTANEFVGKGLYAVHTGTGYQINRPTATVLPNAPSDYDVEVAVDAPYDAAAMRAGAAATPPVASMSVQGADAGLLISTDNNNYFQIYSKEGGTNAYPNTYLTIAGARVGGYDNFQQYYPYTSAGPNLYRIKKVGATITLSLVKVGQIEYVMGTVSASDTDAYKAGVYAFLSDMSNKKITLFNNNSFTATPAVADIAFSRFYTSLPLVNGPLTATGSVSLEGVSDLSLISAGAPLGTFHVSLRTPGTATEVLGADVTLTTAAGSGAGTFAIPGVTPGTYDVNVKGNKNLSATDANVALSSSLAAPSSAIPALSLGAGDANNDNVADTSDFNILAGAFGAAFDPAQPNSVTGYEPTGDFNFDGVIDTSDFNLLVGEFGNAGY